MNSELKGEMLGSELEFFLHYFLFFVLNPESICWFWPTRNLCVFFFLPLVRQEQTPEKSVYLQSEFHWTWCFLENSLLPWRYRLCLIVWLFLLHTDSFIVKEAKTYNSWVDEMSENTFKTCLQMSCFVQMSEIQFIVL